MSRPTGYWPDDEAIQNTSDPMNLPTDEQLEKRALHMAAEGVPPPKDFVERIYENDISIGARNGFYLATLEALKIERESYRLLVGYRHALTLIAARPNSIEEVDTHLTTLRTRLGITE